MNIPNGPEGLNLSKKELTTKENNDSVLINITAEFNENNIINIENEFQKSYAELEETEVECFGITIYFYEQEDDKCTLNFRIESTHEKMGEDILKIHELVEHLGGEIID